jgi:cytochrome b561
MTFLKNTHCEFGIVSIALHWGTAILLVALCALGLYMVTLPDAGFNDKKIMLILLHKQVGILTLYLVFLRIGWRIINVLPALEETIPEWQKTVARFVHLLFYALMLALPLSGWLMSSSAGIPVSFFGLFTLPNLISYDEYLFRLFILLHRWLAYGLMGLLCIHAGAALMHHFLMKDRTLAKMLPHNSI